MALNLQATEITAWPLDNATVSIQSFQAHVIYVGTNREHGHKVQWQSFWSLTSADSTHWWWTAMLQIQMLPCGPLAHVQSSHQNSYTSTDSRWCDMFPCHRQRSNEMVSLVSPFELPQIRFDLRHGLKPPWGQWGHRGLVDLADNEAP